jgi:UDP-N-acetylglucosamine acyltransferase
MAIDKTAIVSAKAEIGKNVEIGAYSIVEDDVVIQDNTKILSHVLVASGTRLAKNCTIFHGAVLGTIPQDLKFTNEKTTLEIGADTVIREYATLNRGTVDRGKTVIGKNCLIMAYVHIAHDCKIGDHVIIANAVNMAGHITIEDYVGIGGMVPIHQFVKIGTQSFIGGGFRVAKDVPPYILAAGEPLRYAGLNLIGLDRRGMKKEVQAALKKAYRFFYRANLNVNDALKKIEEEIESFNEIKHLVSFIKQSERGIIR